MQRREFIRLFGGVAAAWSLEASAQQPERMRRVGVLMGIAESDPAQQSFVSVFTRALQDLGWHAGRNVRIDYLWGAGDADKIQSFAREFVEQKLGHTTPVVAALKQQTSTIPIVFTQVSDPIGSHFVDGLAHPGGNITGFTNLEASIGAKLMELLKEVAPQTSRVALMFNPATSPANGSYFLKPVEAAAPIVEDGSGCRARSQPRRDRAHYGAACARAEHRPVSPRGAVHRPHSQGRAVAVIGQVAVEGARNVRAIGKRRASNFALSSLSH
jgi:putative ABC transport system substrate-binding protein